MADGIPKDYSVLYCDESNSSRLNPAKVPLDGMVRPAKRESPIQQIYNGRPIDMKQLAAKLQNFANNTLNEHYSTFREQKKLEQAGFKVYIQYYDDKNTFVVRVNHNSLKAIKQKLPKRGNYRYFFRSDENTSEEFELDGACVPCIEKGDQKIIYCQLFPI